MINHLIGFHPSFGLLIMRIVLGTIFILHGYKKLFKNDGREQLSGFLKTAGIPAPETIALIISVIEFIGGICIVTGLYMRLASAINALSMFAAILIMKKKNGEATTSKGNSWVGGIELAITLGTMAIILLAMGAGKFSLDVIVLNEW